MIKKLIRWFNNYRTGYVRVRVCEKCYRITSQNHWSKADYHYYEKIVYDHIWLCYKCFYGRRKEKTHKN